MGRLELSSRLGVRSTQWFFSQMAQNTSEDREDAYVACCWHSVRTEHSSRCDFVAVRRIFGVLGGRRSNHTLEPLLSTEPYKPNSEYSHLCLVHIDLCETHRLGAPSKEMILPILFLFSFITFHRFVTHYTTNQLQSYRSNNTHHTTIQAADFKRQ